MGVSDPGRFDPENGLGLKIRSWTHNHRYWLMIVVLPTLLVAAYYILFASQQYESEAHFLVRSGDSSPPPTPSLGSALGLGGGSPSGAAQMAPITDYLTSHDAVAALQQKLDIVDRFRRPGIDPWSRLWSAHPSPEKLLAYYRGQVKVDMGSDTGIASIKVLSFSPQDSYAIANAMLVLGEDRVNSLNQRAYESTLGIAQRQLGDAERSVSDVEHSVTAFRQNRGDFNPEVTGTARVQLVTGLQSSLAQARAQLASMESSLSPRSPQVMAARARVDGLEAQVNAEQRRLSQGRGNVATALGSYESLQLQQQFAAKRYDSAASALDKAREQLIRQQLFVVRVVNPNMPVRALYPKTGKIILTVFATLMLVYGLGWLIVAGMKEHTA